ncbi:hypothetical protein HAX54_021474, partial [Datura stramonium]|nr:hypothetical protein [Datura stramonium]
CYGLWREHGGRLFPLLEVTWALRRFRKRRRRERICKVLLPSANLGQVAVIPMMVVMRH